MMPVSPTARSPLFLAGNIPLHFSPLAHASIAYDTCPGEILVLVGPNDTGKTIKLNCLNSFYRPQRGKILFDQHALVHTSTLDNLMAARHIHMKQDMLAGALYFGLGHKNLIDILTMWQRFA